MTPHLDFAHSLPGLLGIERFNAILLALAENIKKNKELLARLEAGR